MEQNRLTMFLLKLWFTLGVTQATIFLDSQHFSVKLMHNGMEQFHFVQVSYRIVIYEGIPIFMKFFNTLYG